MSFVEMRGISKRFGATVALSDVGLDVETAEVHALVGENGSGKSTLMRVLAGALRPDSGEMRIDGKLYKPRNPMDGRKSGVAMIHQELSICPHLSVAENVMLGMEPSRMGLLNGGEMRKAAGAALTKLGHGDLDTTIRCSLLPIGMRQIVEIARAVAVGSRVVILDEPTSSLSEKDVERLFAVVEVLRKEGHAVIYISHFLDEVQRVSDKITVLRDGERIVTRDNAGISEDEIISLMVGRTISELFPRSQHEPGDIIISVRGLCGIEKPLSVDLDLRRGEVLGIAGLNGAGRTELLRALFGLDRIRSGEIKLGVHIGPASPARRWRQGAGLLSEDRKEEGLALGMSIADNMTMTNLGMLSSLGVISEVKQSQATTKWIEHLGIKCISSRQSVSDLSGGNQQKVALARLLNHGVDVFFLDEPTRGIDVASKQQIYKLIDELALSGKAILIAGSYLPELLGICDRIAVMRKGVLGVVRSVEETNSEMIMQEALGG